MAVTGNSLAMRIHSDRRALLALQIVVLVAFFALWYVLTATKILDPFFFGSPVEVVRRTVDDFVSGTIYRHLWITLLETMLAFAIGTVGGIIFGFWFARSPLVSAVFDPYIKAANAIPRVVLAPIFALWLGLGIWSKVALGVTLVFFIVFFNVYQGVKEVSPVVLANARMLGMNAQQLLRHVYLPSALSWVFSSLHTAVGFALVGAVVGEYLGASAGLGYRIAQAEGVFDTNGVFSGMLILTAFVILIDGLVSAIEAKLLVWRPTAASTVASAAGAQG
jgi:NitT/TauT family transport system permease protein